MKNETYEEFVDKFKPKKTTDDCYTPEIVYKAVSDWVLNEYDLNACDFVRPFYPGGDFEHFDYENKKIRVGLQKSYPKFISFQRLQKIQF